MSDLYRRLEKIRELNLRDTTNRESRETRETRWLRLDGNVKLNETVDRRIGHDGLMFIDFASSSFAYFLGFYYMSVRTGFKHFELLNCELNDEELYSIAEFVLKHNTLKTLILSDMKLNNSMLGHLSDALRKGKHVIELEFINNDMSGVKRISEYFKHMQLNDMSVETLRFVGNKMISKKEMKDILFNLRMSEKINEFHLSVEVLDDFIDDIISYDIPSFQLSIDSNIF